MKGSFHYTLKSFLSSGISILGLFTTAIFINRLLPMFYIIIFGSVSFRYSDAVFFRFHSGIALISSYIAT